MSVFKQLIIPDDQRVFFVGDIHGAFDLYQKGCKDLGITDEDVVISLGDLIDRGDKNLTAVLEFTKKPNRYAILGNHEDLLVKGFVNNSMQHFECWFLNGGAQTWEEVGGEDGSRLLAEMLKDLPVIIEVEHQGKTFGCVHGGIPRDKTVWEDVVINAVQNPSYQEALVWDRSIIDNIKYQQQMDKNPEQFIYSVQGIDYVLHGHTPVKQPVVVQNRIYMDTGGIFNNKLTFAWYENDEMNFYTTGDYEEM